MLLAEPGFAKRKKKAQAFPPGLLPKTVTSQSVNYSPEALMIR
jgi:hypothetical protein